MSQPSVVCLNSLRSAGVGIVGVRSAGVGIADVRSAGVGHRSREARQRRSSMLVIIIIIMYGLHIMLYYIAHIAVWVMQLEHIRVV